MSVAGILAGNFLAGLGTQYAQPSQLSPINTNASSAFAAIQQKLSASGSAASSSAAPISSELSKLGQDLQLGNLSAAEADYTALKLAISQRHAQLSGQSGNTINGNSNQQGASGTSGASSDPLAAAMQAYSALQQDASAGALSSSLINPISTFSINA